MSVAEAVSEHIKDGDYIGSGGFGTNRISTATLHEIVRQGRENLGFAGHTSTHDFQILTAGHRHGKRLFAHIDVAYVVGLEARGLSRNARRVMESGEVETCEWSNYALASRLRAAAMGVPFIPIRSMLGSDTFTYSAAREILCPFTGVKLAAVPALNPDVAILHVHEADEYGNCRIRGISVADIDLAKASRRVIVTTERLISTEEIRAHPDQTAIPAPYVDAVCEVRHGSYPGNMPGEYASDEKHLREWLEAEQDAASFDAFLDRYIHGVTSFKEYLERCGGEARMNELRRSETEMGDGS
jgi:glutaconate CoA-transferase subunit A